MTPLDQARDLLIAHGDQVRTAIRAGRGDRLGLERGTGCISSAAASLRLTGWWLTVRGRRVQYLGANGSAALDVLAGLAGVPAVAPAKQPVLL